MPQEIENKLGAISGTEAVQLNACGWFLEEQKQTEDAINHIRRVLGTFRADSDPTSHYLQGYLSGVLAMYHKFENVGFGDIKSSPSKKGNP